MFKSKDEINKTFQDHIDSLKMSGLPFNEDGIRHQWSQALEEFDRNQEILNGED